MEADLFRKTFEKASVGMVILDQLGTLVLGNPALGSILGITAHTLKDRRLEDFLQEEDRNRWIGFYSEFVAGRAPDYYFESLFLPADRRKAWWSLQLADIDQKDSAGQPLFFAIVQDISLKKLYEIKLREARAAADRASRAKSQFLANMSHEIRTPIHTIAGMSELLQETPLNRDQKDFVHQVANASDVLLSLVNDVLDFSKIEAGKLILEREEFDIRRVLDQTVSLLAPAAASKDLEFLVFEDSGLPHLCVGDPNRLRQILVNLVSNAVKFTKEGEVELSARPHTETSETITLEFRVRDTGIGIDQSLKDQLFEAFYQADNSHTRKFGGTGLGLSISQKLVRQLGGDIRIESLPGKGTTVTFTVVLAKPSRENAPAFQPDPRWIGRRALVVDDHPRARSIVASYLGEWGFDVTCCAFLTEAEGFLKTCNFELVILDAGLKYPDPWSWALQFHARQGNSRIPLLFLTPQSHLRDRPKGQDPHEFPVYKPLRRHDLLKVLEKAFRLREGPEEDPKDEQIRGGETIPRMRILVAEDHDVNRELFSLLLHQMGHEVILAVNGTQAVELNGQLKPDLIFMDLQMPELNGFEATYKIRKEGSVVPIVAVTASALKGEVERCLQSGMNGCITKPFRSQDLRATLQQLWESPETRTYFQLRPAQTPEPVMEQGEAFSWEECLEVFLGKEDLVKKLLVKFQEKARQHLTALEDALGKSDWQRIREEAHAIKGSAFNLTAKDLGKAAGNLEAAGKEGLGERCGPLLEELKSAYKLFLKAIEPHL